MQKYCLEILKHCCRFVMCLRELALSIIIFMAKFWMSTILPHMVWP